MKTIHLADDLNMFLHEAVQSGRYASEESVISDALCRLRDAINGGEKGSDQSSSSCQPGTPLTKQAFQRHLVEIGILEPSLPAVSKSEKLAPTSTHNEEEILSEVLIRERLIEWLTGFLT